ncbi:MAG: methyltransferase domain-containing protein [Akkermansiaceae bacterium]
MATEQRDWNQDYSVGRTPWDKGAPSPALLEVLDSEELPAGSEVLVPGCGYGHDVSAIAKAGCMVTGLDISELALAGAKSLNSADGARYELGDFFDLAHAEAKRYDVIWEHTCFCAITPDQRDRYVDAAHRLLKPEGILIGVFFAFAQPPEDVGPPYKTNIESIERHFKKYFTLEWGRLPQNHFPTREGEEWLMCWRPNQSQA